MDKKFIWNEDDFELTDKDGKKISVKDLPKDEDETPNQDQDKENQK